jgi:hypothetical protein
MPIEVLLVEDNAGGVQLIQEAFRDVNPLIYLHIAYDGLEAIAFCGSGESMQMLLAPT